MTALDQLAAQLAADAARTSVRLSADDGLDAILVRLRRYASTGSLPPSEDIQLQAVCRFWEQPHLETPKDARLVSFGLCTPVRPGGPSLLDDRDRFRALLNPTTGVGQWLGFPRWYRRCYQGLVRSYFLYDASAREASAIGQQNWHELRDYLRDHAGQIAESGLPRPPWVDTALEHRHLFGPDPCAHYAADLLRGDTSTIDRLREQLGITGASWFLRDLVLAQIRVAAQWPRQNFVAIVPRLLDILAEHAVLRDRGLILVLDAYARLSPDQPHRELRERSVAWWGNPWLPSNDMRWGGVTQETREMVADWLKRDFIEAFFTKLAQDGIGDRRRMNFWLRYVKSMDHVHFALGTTAQESRDPHLATLRRKMQGLITPLKDTVSSNNAFIMTLGDLVAVEFGATGNALYGYDSRESLPFDLSQPVVTRGNAKNSLKHVPNVLRINHTDGLRPGDQWEDRFESELRQRFRLEPAPANPPLRSSPPRHGRPAMSRPGATPPHTERAGAAVPPFTRAGLDDFARAHRLQVRDRSLLNGHLWVMTDDVDPLVSRVLRAWGFRYQADKSGGAWWR